MGLDWIGWDGMVWLRLFVSSSHTFAHEQHAGPEQRLIGHGCYVDAFGTGMFQAGAVVDKSEVSLRVLMAACLEQAVGIREESVERYPQQPGLDWTRTSLNTASVAQTRETARAWYSHVATQCSRVLDQIDVPTATSPRGVEDRD